MSESKWREAYSSGYSLGYGDGLHEARRRAVRFDRPAFFLAGMAAGLLAGIALRLAAA